MADEAPAAAEAAAAPNAVPEAPPMPTVPPPPLPPPTAPREDSSVSIQRSADDEERALARVLGTSSEALAPPSVPIMPAAAAVVVPQVVITPEQQEIDSRSIYVGNVDYRTSIQELQLLFASCGPIQRITIPCDRYTNTPKGFAYIEFGFPDSVERALALNLTWKNRPLKIVAKRSNVPGLAQHAARTPPVGFRARRPPWRGAPRRGTRPFHPYSAGE